MVFPKRKVLKIEITATKGSSLILILIFSNNQTKLVVLSKFKEPPNMSNYRS
jgi:hypothetical protein